MKVAKRKSKRDERREHRITMDIVVDCYDEYERAMGWYYYLENQLQFPFTATCITKRAISLLQVKDEVDVIGLPDLSECQREMFVTIPWEKDGLAVPLSQLKPIRETGKQTKQAVEDWHYWVRMGYGF